MLERYFDERDSIYSVFHQNIDKVLETISQRYIGNNPPHPMMYRAFQENGMKRMGDYRYHFNLSEHFPDAKDGQVVYAWAKIWMESETNIALALNCFGPTTLFVNGEKVFRSTIVEETNPNRKVANQVKLPKGWSHFVLKFVKTPSGLGGIFGTGSFKRYPLHFLAPSFEREGQEGWLFSFPQEDKELQQIPRMIMNESETNITWLPELNWSQLEEKKPSLTRMFGSPKDTYAVAWTKLLCERPGTQEYEFRGEGKGPLDIFLDGQKIEVLKDGEFHFSVKLSYGSHDLVIKSYCENENWGFILDSECELVLPYPVKGVRDHWLYLGPFSKKQTLPIQALLRVNTLFENEEGGMFWRVDAPHMSIRPYLENRLFGKWDYPLGVTLFGLLNTASHLNRKDIMEYVRAHIQQSVSLYRYSIWDKEKYGASGVNNQLSAIDSLDDCGSFGSTMLLAEKIVGIQESHEVAKDIATYISTLQDRLEDGTLYRKRGSVEFMKDTIWCDDLYMSTPFLCRYYEQTGDSRYLDDAARQFLLYKKYLFMPGKRVMSHVYDFKFNTATNVPWGRGNGWVLFSLSELLQTIPQDHPNREELLSFYRELSEGYLALQGKDGLWHQVLTDFESYEETSCTSMFIYAFARGVRFGWFDQQDPYIRSVFKGWNGLTQKGIDRLGNVYGVCKGSGYSFTADYYKHDLGWILNDTHGIGIVLLAGIETLKLQESLER
ncbi:glycoside hydrolase family 88/105 protein [Bacillus solitudinis]|uniref:glycoside hydrolase family 88/105 protein n=1 Tax=Bacillus solitudinis TaxID=2014074 RepID=UPI000C24C29E|nr:glycoside hydrolase family 88 protein [Bacillus solitudinis]